MTMSSARPPSAHCIRSPSWLMFCCCALPPPPPKKPSPPLNNTQAKDVYAQVRQVLEDVQEARQNPDVDQVVSKQSTSKLLL